MTSFVSTTISQECLQLVKSEYDKLNSAIDDLGTNIGSTLDEQKHELERSIEVKRKLFWI